MMVAMSSLNGRRISVSGVIYGELACAERLSRSVFPAGKLVEAMAKDVEIGLTRRGVE